MAALDFLSELFGVGGAQAAEAPSGFVPPAGPVPVPMARPQNLGTLPTAPTVQTPESADPSSPGPFGNVLARLNARRQNVAGADGSLSDAGGGGAGMLSGAAAGMGHSKFGAFANGMMLGMKANSDSKKSNAAAQRQALMHWAGVTDKEEQRAETKRYHDILGDYYTGQNSRPGRGAGGAGGGAMTPAAIELARSRAAKRLGLMEPLPQYATDDQKREHAERRAEAQRRFDQWDGAQPWGGKGGAVMPPPDDDAAETPPAVAPSPAPAITPPVAPPVTPSAAPVAPAAAPAAPAADTWVRVRNRNDGSVQLYNPATKQMKPIGGE